MRTRTRPFVWPEREWQGLGENWVLAIEHANLYPWDYEHMDTGRLGPLV